MEHAQREYYDEHYARRAALVAELMAHPPLREMHDRMAAHILDRAPDRAALRVYEAGCGEGLFASALLRVAASRKIEVRYTGSDISASALRLAATAVPGELIAGDAVEVTSQLPGASFDLVVVKNLLHHLPAPHVLVSQVRRVLAPGGRFAAAEASLGSPQAWLFSLLSPRRERYFFVSARRRNRLAFARAGLEVVDVAEFGLIPYELLFVIRPAIFRRIVPSGEAAAERMGRLDERLTRVLRPVSNYDLWVLGHADG